MVIGGGAACVLSERTEKNARPTSITWSCTSEWEMQMTECTCPAGSFDFACQLHAGSALVTIAEQLHSVAEAIENGHLVSAEFSWKEGEAPTLKVATKVPVSFIQIDLKLVNLDQIDLKLPKEGSDGE